MSEDEYLALDRQSELRWEYVAGEAFERGGARPEHNLVVANVGRALGVALADRPCVVLASQQKISTGPRVVQRRRRQPTGEWTLSWHHDGAVELTSVGATLSLEDVYDELDLTSDGAPPG